MRYDRLLLSLDDVDLERFTRDWVERKDTLYVECVRFSGPGDKGRDVVGFLSSARHEGPWHSYQCKQYNRALPTEIGIREIGKILYHSWRGDFTLPERYFFVSPKGVNRNLESLLFNPSTFKARLLSDWAKICSQTIRGNRTINLDRGLRDHIESYDFSKISRITLDDILNDPHAKPVLAKWFGADPGPPPKGRVPAEIQASELTYISQLVDAYSDRAGTAYSGHDEISCLPTYGAHLTRQRERFHDAEAFKRFYRDTLEKGIFDDFEEDIYHGVVETCTAPHNDKLECVDSVMAQAARVAVSGLLSPHTRVPVKQGVCHHFANENRLKWRR